MKKRKLYQTEKSIYAIANEILEIIKTRTIMPPISIGNNTVSEAVKNRSFEEARQLNIQFLKEHNIPIQNDITDILLTDLNNLISKLTEENTFETSILISTGPESTLDYESIIKSAEEIAYYLNAERISIDRAKSIYHLTEEQVLLIKLIYARDYYTEGLYQKGDKLLSEVENSSNQTPVVTTLLDEVKTNRASYKELISPYTKKRVNLTDK